MNKLAQILSILYSSLLLLSCSTQHSDIVIAKFDGEKITMAEFEKAFTKNSGGIEKALHADFEDYKKFADLYVNFKMRIKNAYEKGYNKDEALINELTEYKKKVGAAYIQEKYLVDPNLIKLFERRKEEIRVSHIMITPAQSGGADSAKLIAKKILDSIKMGIPFEQLAKAHSQDFYSKDKGGDIFYFTGGQLPIEFEDVCYNMQPNTVYPEVVQTKFGYHIIKLTERKPRIARVQAAHILASFMNEEGEVDSAKAKAKIDSVVIKLKEGQDFAQLAAEYSDDTGTKDRGGDLGFFERRMMVQPFDEVVFNMEVGQISDIVETQFGYHIIKLLGKEEQHNFEKEKENLKNILRRTRYDIILNNYIDQLKNEFSFKIFDNNLQTIVENADTAFIGADYPNSENVNDLIVYSYGNININFDSFYSKLKKDSEFTGRKFEVSNLKDAINKYVKDELLEYKSLGLDTIDSNFADLMNDYKNGIFIFKILEEEVWNKLTIDSVKLYQYYLENKEKYTWPDRAAFTEIWTTKDSLANVYLSQLKKGEVEFDSLAKKTERVEAIAKAGKYELTATANSQLAKIAFDLNTEGSISDVYPNSGGFSIIRLDIKDPARLKTFSEAKAEVTGAYQELESKRLENQYLELLRKKYKPVIYYDNIKKAFKKEN